MKDPRWTMISGKSDWWRTYKLTCTCRDLISWIQNEQIDVRYKMSYEDALKCIYTDDNKNGIDYRDIIDNALDEDITLDCYDSGELACWENKFILNGIELKFNTLARPFECEYEDCFDQDEDDE